MPELSDNPATRSRPIRSLLLIFVAGFGLLLFAYSIVRGYEKKWHRDHFNDVAKGPIQEIKRRADINLEVLRSVGQLFAASQSVENEEFRSFVNGPLQRYPELIALEWLPRLDSTQRPEFEQTTGILIRESDDAGQLQPAPPAQEYFPVRYAEPHKPHQVNLGLNRASNPLLRKTMTRACDQGQPIIAGREPRLPKSSNSGAYLCRVFLPIYNNLPVDPDLAKRRSNLTGFVSAILDPHRLVHEALPPRTLTQVDVQILDESAPAEEQLLSLHIHGNPNPNLAEIQPWTTLDSSTLLALGRFPLAGRDWAIVNRPTTLFTSQAKWQAGAVLAGGSILLILFCGYLYALLGRTSQIERTVTLRTSELAEANQKLQAEVAERKKTEAAISQSEARLLAILDNSTTVIYLKDTQGRYLLINRQYESLFGVTRDEIRGKSDRDLFPPEVADAFEKNDQQTLQAGTAVQFEEAAPVDGTLHTYISIKFPLLDPAGLPYGVCGISTNITDRVQAERALKDSEALYHSLVECLPLNVVRKDRHGLITFGNELFCRTLGRPFPELLGKSDFDLFPPNLAEKYVADDNQVIQTGQVFEDIEEHHTPEGEDLYMHVLKSPVRDANGDIVGLQVMFWDVTARRRAEKALEHTMAELSRSNHELEQFAYVASHDLQEPLRMIASYTQLLARRYRGKLDAAAEEFIDYAVDGAVRMQKLINDLLSFSRVGTRGKPFASTDSKAILQTALTNLKIAIEETKARVTHDPLPTILADSTQLTQLVQNLISNAIKFRGSEPPHVHISARQDGPKWIFQVTDNGIGIDPQYFERIFVIFQRLHSHQEYTGTGIGLAICKKIVERHHGTIWVESNPGRGSSFFFSLPASPRPTPAPPQKPRLSD